MTVQVLTSASGPDAANTLADPEFVTPKLAKVRALPRGCVLTAG